VPRDTTPLLPGFPHRFGRPRQKLSKRFAEAQQALRDKQLWELRDLFGSWIDVEHLEPTEAGANSRRRIFSLEIVFWAFLCQILAGLGCAAAVKRVQSWRIHRGQSCPSSDTGAYCKARSRLPQSVLEEIFTGTAEAVSQSAQKWFGRRVRVADGTGLSMPDTKDNQRDWPQNSNMKAGCGFPMMKLVGLFDLFSGAWLAWAEGNKHDSEHSLWTQLWKHLEFGDIVLGDSLYSAYAFVGALHARGIDGVYRLGGQRKINWNSDQRLGPDDLIQTWDRPRRKPAYMSAAEWAEVPISLQVRVLRQKIEVAGFRPTTITLVTTLLDAEDFPAEEIFLLYRRRWAVELYFRDIKIALGMDILRSRTPEQIRKELTMHAICYNLLRGLIQAAAKRADIDPASISFKGAAEQLDQWSWLFLSVGERPGDRRALLEDFYAALTSAPLPDRPNRVEPRVRKRRPKNYRKMTRPRHSDPPVPKTA